MRPRPGSPRPLQDAVLVIGAGMLFAAGAQPTALLDEGGRSNAAIAERLSITEKAVVRYLSRQASPAMMRG